MDAILPRPRAYETVAADLRAHQDYRMELFKIAGEFAATQVYPIFIVNGVMEPHPPLELPPNLGAEIQRENDDIARLEYELLDAYERARQARRERDDWRMQHPGDVRGTESPG